VLLPSARRREPRHHHKVAFTGGWSLPVKEAEAANSLTIRAWM
jgi:hypothetical protein